MQHKLLIAVFLFIQMIACDKPNIDQLSGSWRLKEITIDHAAISLCNELSGSENINMEIEPEGENFRFAGNSFVNAYFGTFVLSDFKKNTGKISTSGIGSTKKMGPPDLQNCENSYFDALNIIQSFEQTENGKLILKGILAIDNKDAEVLLTFDRL